MTITTSLPTRTFDELLEPLGIALPDETLRGAEIPVLTGAQRQGDVGVFPRPRIGKAERDRLQPIPATGEHVVRGEATGNTHLLFPADGPSQWAAATGRERNGLTLGILHVPAGSVCYLLHTDEHGGVGIGPGTYTLQGKREQAEEIRRVAD